MPGEPAHEGIGRNDPFDADGVPVPREGHFISRLQAYGLTKGLGNDDLPLSSDSVSHTSQYNFGIVEREARPGGASLQMTRLGSYCGFSPIETSTSLSPQGVNS